METAEKVERKSKTIKIEDFIPQDAKEFLPDWQSEEVGTNSYHGEKMEFIRDGWRFERVLNGVKWELTVNSNRKDYRMVELRNSRDATSLQLREISKVEFDYQRHFLIFSGKNGKYSIQGGGALHIVRTPNVAFKGEVSVQ